MERLIEDFVESGGFGNVEKGVSKKASSGSPSGWRLLPEAVDRAPIDLPEGRHTIGATPASTFLVALPWSCEGARLRVGRAGVEVRALDSRVPVKIDGQALSEARRIPVGKRETLLEIGPVRLRLLGRARPIPREGVLNMPFVGPSNRWVWLGGSATCIAALLGALVMLPPSATVATPAPRDRSMAEFTERELSSPLPRWSSGASASRRDVVLDGVLVTRADCDRMQRIRAARGVDQFFDRTVCLPEVIDHANDLLAGTNLRAEGVDDAVHLLGVADEADAERWLAALKAALPGLRVHSGVTVRAARPTPDAGGELTRVARQLVDKRQGLIRAAGGRGMLVMEDGRIVRTGDELAPGVTLVRFESEAALLSVMQQPLRVPMVDSLPVRPSAGAGSAGTTNPEARRPPHGS